MTRIPKEMFGDKLTVFGIQSYVKDFLIERFNETFFNVPLEEAMAEYEMIIGDTFPLEYVNTGKFEALHKLGYLPVEIGCLAEAIHNTNKWDLVLFLEPTVEFVQDGTRSEEIASNRLLYSNKIKEILDKYSVNYITINGDYTERFNESKRIIKDKLGVDTKW